MGLVKISEPMHENLRVASNALSRSINAQAEHWMRIGMLCELHPGLNYSDLCRLLVEAELNAEAAGGAASGTSAEVVELPSKVRA